MPPKPYCTHKGPEIKGVYYKAFIVTYILFW